MIDLKTKIGSMVWKNPVTVASGTFGYEYDDLFDLSRLGALVTKAVTYKPKKGNEPCRIVETKAGLLNSIGLQNPGVDGFISEVLPNYEKIDTNLIVSISAGTVDEFCKIAAKLDHFTSINALEVNISCPNVEKEGLAFGVDPKVVSGLVSALRNQTKKDLIVKLSPNVTSIEEIAVAAAESGADALSLINTVRGLSVDIETSRSKIKNGIAGYSGPAIKPIALQNVYRVAQVVDIPIIGMGGIVNYKDALQFIIAGASAIAVGTANFANPLTSNKIIDELESYCEQKKITLIELIGSLEINK